jgi:transposase
VSDIIRIGMDTSKSVFQLHGVDAAEQPVLRKKLRRRDVLSFFERLAPTAVGMEACGGTYYWARELSALGHEVKLMPAQHVKPYVRRGKNDRNDADAICEAMSRPRMRFVAIKTVDQQAAQMLMTTRERLVAYRTQLLNTIRGHAAEFGLTAAKGPAHVEPLLLRVAEDAGVPELARELFAMHGQELSRLKLELREIEAKLKAWHRQNEMSRRLAEIDAIGPIGGCLLAIKAPDPQAFRCGRDFAAWMGLTPKDHSTAGKTRHGVITRAGDEALRRTLVAGATSVIKQVNNGKGNPSPWLRDLVGRKPAKLAAVALANKVARIAWKLMRSGQPYDPARAGIVSPRESMAPGSRPQGRFAPPAAVACGQP